MDGSPPPAGMALHALADRPELVDGVHVLGTKTWPTFMLSGPVGESYYEGLGDTFIDCAVVLVDEDEEVIARALWIPFVWAARCRCRTVAGSG